MMDHTPGSWQVSPAPATKPGAKHSLRVIRQAGGYIAKGVHSPGMSRQEAEANARLIAAAPETDTLLSQFTAYLQGELFPSIRSLEGGQTLIDAGWNLVKESHALKALATP